MESSQTFHRQNRPQYNLGAHDCAKTITGLGNDRFGELKVNADGSVYIRVDSGTADVVIKAAKAERKTPAKFLQRVLDDWNELQAGKRFWERMKKRIQPTSADYAKMTTHAQIKKDPGL